MAEKEYIEREKLDKWLLTEFASLDGEEDRKFVVERLRNEIPAADVREVKWIPVTERLPVKGEWVLTYSKFVKPMTDFIDKYGSWYRTPAVTHWMPLPERPKEET